ncbi:hypothetical protein LZ30DRAFT_428999 [Colletotrichum cereale]|nr:hypothetical protein LZ30DRAFT_428999 [Colletotrichum cereale]
MASGLKVADRSTPPKRDYHQNTGAPRQRRRCTGREESNSAIWHQHAAPVKVSRLTTYHRTSPEEEHLVTQQQYHSAVESPSWQARMHEVGRDTHLPCQFVALSPSCLPTTLDVMQSAHLPGPIPLPVDKLAAEDFEGKSGKKLRPTRLGPKGREGGTHASLGLGAELNITACCMVIL